MCKKAKINNENVNLAEYLNLPPLQKATRSPPFSRYLYVDSGYRVKYNIKHCIYSILTFHNETMNIWTHLIGLIVLLITSCFLLIDYLEINEENNIFNGDLSPKSIDFLLSVLYLFSAGSVFFLSVIYHTFGCLSEPCHDCLLKFDLFGICLLLFGSYFPMIYYGFYCNPTWQYFYLVLDVFVLITGAVVAWFGGGASNREFWTRTIGFTFLTVIGIAPATHWMMIAPKQFREKIQWGILGMFSSYGVGLFFYVSKIPERIWPKWVASSNFTSHSCWHLAVISGIYVWWDTLNKVQYLVREENDCSKW